ncbi:hypothetical protein SBV1_2200021 [Verrucomicrobia bacterium]|nr:hypothetical protein SBV1_2200021 [Verrucomicrobiota bacterium]
MNALPYSAPQAEQARNDLRQALRNSSRKQVLRAEPGLNRESILSTKQNACVSGNASSSSA